jgi:hypothetical protein
MAVAKPANGTALIASHDDLTSLTGYWPMLEGTGESTADLSGSGNHLTFGGATKPTWSTSDWGATIALPDTDDILYNAGGSASLKQTDYLTAAVLVKLPATLVTCVFATKTQSAFNWHLAYDNGTKVVTARIGTGIANSAANALAAHAGNWVIMAIRHDGDNVIGSIQHAGGITSWSTAVAAIPANDDDLGIGNRQAQTLSVQSEIACAWHWQAYKADSVLAAMYADPWYLLDTGTGTVGPMLRGSGLGKVLLK